MRRRALIEVLAVWSVVFLIVKTAHWNPIAQWCNQYGQWNYFSHAVYVILPLVVLWLSRRRLCDYGLTLAGWRSGLVCGGGIAAATALPYLVAHAAGWIVFDRSRGVVDTLLFQMVMAGFGEEILGRGYYQSRLNEGFGRSWTILNVRFGWGLILGTLIFGFDHVLNPFDPFHGRFELAPSWGLGVLTSGLMFAALRERTGSILAPAIVHGLEDVCFCFTSPGPAVWVVASIDSMLGWSVFMTALGWSASGRQPAQPFEARRVACQRSRS